jgi:uncharacterized protein YegP (UPF0339 family)
MSQHPYFYVYTDSAGEWRWRLRASNDKIIADSGEGYYSQSGCEEAVARVQREAPIATVLPQSQ